MSAYSIASNPAKSQPRATANESPNAERQKVCSYHCLFASRSRSVCNCAALQISSASASYDATSLGFMPDLQGSKVGLGSTSDSITGCVRHLFSPPAPQTYGSAT